MEQIRDRKKISSSSPTSNGTKEARMTKPSIHTTKYGTQYIDPVELIKSEAGWAEIERLREANLIPNVSSNGKGESSSSPENDVG